MACRRLFSSIALSRQWTVAAGVYTPTSKIVRPPGSTWILNCPSSRRGIKSTSTVHPDPIHKDDEEVLEKVLKERENSEDLPESMANPYEKPRRVCILCKYGIEPDYKNTKLLYQFVSPYTGKVYGRHITGLCKAKQRKLEVQITVAVSLGFMSNYLKEPEYLADPKLCDPDRPVRPHPY